MFAESVGPVLGSIPSLVVKYGVIWLALYAARHFIVLLVSPHLSMNNSLLITLPIVLTDRSLCSS